MYENDLRAVATQVWEALNKGSRRLTKTINLILSSEQLNALATEGELQLNLLDLGLVDPTWEDARISEMKVTDASSTVMGNAVQTADVRFEFLQPSQSILQRGGATFLFNHPRDSIGEAIWATDYNALDNSGTPLVQAPPSDRTIAALEALLDIEIGTLQNDAVGRLFSSPSAWSTISIRRRDTLLGSNASVDLSEVRLQIELDYSINDDLAALVVRSRVPARFSIKPQDLPGNQDADGSFRRFFSDGEVVTLQAEPLFGSHLFIGWLGEESVVTNEPKVELVADSVLTLDASYALPGDASTNGKVGFEDFLLLSENFGKAADAAWSDGDFDLDGSVGFQDFLILSQAFEIF